MIDSHCHLAGREFSADLPEVIERATTGGVKGALCILSEGDADEDLAASRLRTLWPAAHFATGIHPHNAGAHAGQVEQAVEAVGRRVLEHRAVAIGEIGLDYHYDFSPRDVQQEIFRAQIELAKRMALPVVIHTREATDDTLRLLSEAGGGELRGVFHCFSGDEAMAQAGTAFGLLPFLCRDRDLSQGRVAPRGRPDDAVGSPAGGDGCTVSRAGPAPRQAERTGVRRPNRRAARCHPGHVCRGIGRRHDRQLRDPFWPVSELICAAAMA